MLLKQVKYMPKYKLDTTMLAQQQNHVFGIHTAFCRIMVIRGIGYRAYYLKNDFVQHSLYKWNDTVLYELPTSRYLTIRAGHTTDLYMPLEQNINVKISKKDRKLVIYGSDKVRVNFLAGFITKYRLPSVYTGRGIRTKGVKPIRKAGKKDKQKGRAF